MQYSPSKSEQQGQNVSGSHNNSKSDSSSDMLAVNDPQNYYYAYDPEERRMKIVSESANKKEDSRQRKSEEHQPFNIRDEYLAMCEQTPDEGETPQQNNDNQIKESKSGFG